MLRDTLGALCEIGGELRETLGALERKLGVLRETGGDELTLGRDTLGEEGRKLGELDGRIVCALGVLGRGCAATWPPPPNELDGDEPKLERDALPPLGEETLGFDAWNDGCREGTELVDAGARNPPPAEADAVRIGARAPAAVAVDGVANVRARSRPPCPCGGATTASLPMPMTSGLGPGRATVGRAATR